MVRDYAKKTYSRKRKNKKPSRHFGLYLLILLLFSLFFTGLYYKKATNPEHVAPTSTTTKKITKAADKPVSPVFEFYTLLPKIKNPLDKPHQTLQQPNIKPVTKNYFLQISALQHQEEVDTLKAKLLLLGFDVVIKKVIIKGETWYRVNIGPYTSLSALRADQNRLHENHINSILE